MGLRCVPQRVRLADLDPHQTASDHVEQFACTSVRARRGSRCSGTASGESDTASRAATARATVNGGTGPEALPKLTMSPRGRRQSRDASNVSLADGIVDDIGAPAVGQLAHARGPGRLVLEQHVRAQPRRVTSSAFASLPTMAMTVAPRCLAHCTAIDPTPPAAARMTTAIALASPDASVAAGTGRSFP